MSALSQTVMRQRVSAVDPWPFERAATCSMQGTCSQLALFLQLSRWLYALCWLRQTMVCCGRALSCVVHL